MTTQATLINEVLDLERHIVDAEASRIWAENPCLAATHPTLEEFREGYAVTTSRAAACLADPRGLLSGMMQDQARYAATVGADVISRQHALRPNAAEGEVQSVAWRHRRCLVLWLYGSVVEGAGIPDSIYAPPILEALQRHSDAEAVVLRIDSPGGTGSVAQDICRALLQHRGRKIAIIDRRCYSAATLFIASADRVLMRRSASFMAHFARLSAFGNSDELRAHARQLEAADRALVRHLHAACRISLDELISTMKSERYLPPDEAVRIGFVHQIINDLT